MDKTKNFFIYLILFIPVTLISGPALPDLTITFASIFFLFLLFYKKNFNEIIKFNWVKLSILFWLYLIFISFFAVDIKQSLKEAFIFIRMLMIPLIIYFWIFNKDKYAKYLIIIIFLSVLFVIMDSLYQFFNYESEFGFQNDIFGFKPDFAEFNRLTGPFKDLVPGSFVSRFSFIGVLFFYIFIKKNHLKKILIVFYLSISGYICFISGERMAFVTFGLGLLIFVLFNKNNRIFFSLIFLFLFLLIFISKLFHPSYNDFKVIESSSNELGLIVIKEYPCKNKLLKKCDKKVKFQPQFIEVLKNFKNSAYGEIYLLALEMYKKNAFSGIGMNNFTNLCKNEESYKNKLQNIGCVTHPHNYYLQWLVETGPLGLLLFILYISLIVKFIINKNNNRILNLISIITILIMFWPIMSTGSLLKNWLGINTFLLLGISISLSKLSKFYQIYN